MRARQMVYWSIFVLLCSLLTVSSAVADSIKLRGSGASFPFPLYGLWFNFSFR